MENFIEFGKSSVKNIQSKGLEYLNTVIIIIIFLIFLNLFITTYFYFTTSIQATANRSNCGGASLCEAETHRHLFLEDNGNDKARDIYIIIVVIFSIYLLSEIFKSYKDGIKFDDDENTISVVPILILFLYFAFIVGIIDKAKSKNKNPEGINVVSSALFMFYLFVIGIILYFNKGVENALDTNIIKNIIKFLTVTIPLAIIVVEIAVLAEGSKNDLFKGFSGDDFNLINPKFKANTALHIIFLVFYIIFFAVVLGFNKNIKSLHIWGLVFLAFILFTLFTFILLSSLDFKNTDYTVWLENIKHSTSSMQYFVLLAPLFILYPFKLNISANAIKLLILYYVILFIIYLFYVYFVNHSNETGILSLESFQLYNWASEDKNEDVKGSKEESNYKKELNKANTGFVAVLLLILLVISSLNEDPNLDNIIYGIIVFILASYITGVVYLLYNELFPIQQASFKYKKNLVEINNEISQHIKVEEVEHTIDKNKIRVFKIANENKDIEDIHKRINSERKDGTTSKEKHMKNIRDIFSEISPKGSSYEDYRSQSTDQMQYEEYIYLLFSDNTTKAITPTYSASKINNILSNALNLKRYTDKLHNIYKTVLEDPSKKSSLIRIISKKTYYTNNIYNDTLEADLQTILDKYKNEYFTKIYNESYDKNTQIDKITNVLILGAGSDGFYNEPALQTLLVDLNRIYLASSNKTTFEQYIKDVITDMVSYLELEYTQGTIKTDESGYNNATPTEYSKINLYNKIIIDIPTNIKNLEDAHNIYNDVPLKISKANNIEYVIKKNYKYVTGEEGEIQKYNVLSDTELDCLYYYKTTTSTSTSTKNTENLEASIKAIKNINAAALTITNIATATTETTETTEPTEPTETIYKLNQDIFDHYKSEHTKGNFFITLKGGEIYQNIQHSDIISTDTKYEKLNPAFYTIGYDYENYTYDDKDHQQMNKDTAYSIPARYYACSYLNYFPNEDGSMSKVKFAKNIKEDDYNPLNTKNTIIDRIAKRYDENAKETKIQLAPEKFQFLLVFLVILAIILLMFLFNIIKKYFTGDVYTPQMYVLGILGVFLTIFIFGEVIFARIK